MMNLSDKRRLLHDDILAAERNGGSALLTQLNLRRLELQDRFNDAQFNNDGSRVLPSIYWTRPLTPEEVVAHTFLVQDLLSAYGLPTGVERIQTASVVHLSDTRELRVFRLMATCSEPGESPWNDIAVQLSETTTGRAILASPLRHPERPRDVILFQGGAIEDGRAIVASLQSLKDRRPTVIGPQGFVDRVKAVADSLGIQVTLRATEPAPRLPTRANAKSAPAGSEPT